MESQRWRLFRSSAPGGPCDIRLQTTLFLCTLALLLTAPWIPNVSSSGGPEGSIACVQTCKLQVDAILRELGQYGGQHHRPNLAEEKCRNACEQPPSVCDNFAACQQDYACLVRCWLRDNGTQGNAAVGKATAQLLGKFGTCTRTRIHGDSTGFWTSSRFFWLPLTRARNDGSIASTAVQVTQRAYRRNATQCTTTINRRFSKMTTNRTSIALNTLLGHRGDCLSYHYEMAVADRRRTWPLRVPALHTYNLCQSQHRETQAESVCAGGYGQSGWEHNCRQPCASARQTCSSGDLLTYFRDMKEQARQDSFDLLPEISVMRVRARSGDDVCSAERDTLSLTTSVEWWPGHAGDLPRCATGYLPSCWCYSSCAVRFEARLRIGDQVLAASVNDTGYLYRLQDQAITQSDTDGGPYRSTVTLTFPHKEPIVHTNGQPIQISVRAYYVADVFGARRATWKEHNLSTTCLYSSSKSSGDIMPAVVLGRISPPELRKAPTTTASVRSAMMTNSQSPSHLMAFTVTWSPRRSQAAESAPAEAAERCLLHGYHVCLCTSKCPVVFRVRVIQDGSSILDFQVVGRGQPLLGNATVLFTRIPFPSGLARNSTYSCHASGSPVTVAVEASFVNSSSPSSESRTADITKEWCSMLEAVRANASAVAGTNTPNAGSGLDDRADTYQVVIPLVVLLLLAAIATVLLVVRKSRFGRGSKLLQRMVTERDQAHSDSMVKEKRSSLKLLLNGSSPQSSLASLLNSPSKNEKVNYNYIAMDKLHEAASKGDWTCFPPQLEFPVNQLKLERQIGTGQFGRVWLAKALSIEEDQEWTHVAVKMLKDDSPHKDAQDFLKEAEHLSTFHHPNIIQLLGVVVHGTPKMVVLEYMDGGDLLAHLQTYKESYHLLSDVDFVDIAFDIASGLSYLESKKFVHRDVAARNCLVRILPPSSTSRRRRVTKLADFGLARNVQGGDCYTLVHRDALLPVRWMAPESITKATFTHASDVWSFGILIWEIYSLGEVPYSDCGPSHCVAAHISTGAILDQPAKCPKRMYVMMKNCWSRNPRGRPSFTQLAAMLDSFRRGYARRRSTKSTALTISMTLASVGEYLAGDAGTSLDRMTAQSVACPPSVFEDAGSVATSSLAGGCPASCRTVSSSVFDRSPSTGRRMLSSVAAGATGGGVGKRSHLGDELPLSRTSASLSDGHSDNGSVFNESTHAPTIVVQDFD